MWQAWFPVVFWRHWWLCGKSHPRAVERTGSAGQGACVSKRTAGGGRVFQPWDGVGRIYFCFCGPLRACGKVPALNSPTFPSKTRETEPGNPLRSWGSMCMAGQRRQQPCSSALTILSVCWASSLHWLHEEKALPSSLPRTRETLWKHGLINPSE